MCIDLPTAKRQQTAKQNCNGPLIEQTTVYFIGFQVPGEKVTHATVTLLTQLDIKCRVTPALHTFPSLPECNYSTG